MHGRRLVLAILIAGCQKSPSVARPEVAEAPPATAAPELVTRGRYVAAVSGCVVCHARTLAGGPAPNITPDDETGIGRWSDQEIIDAVRLGVRPDGTKLSPVMPYPHFHRMTDADANALVAFVRHQAPVHDVVAKSAMTMPPPVVMEPTGESIDPIDSPRGHGEYLAMLMHCTACHGDDGAGGKPFALFDGRTVDASNITSDRETGIGQWTEDDIVQTIRTMKTPAGHVIEGPMAGYGEAWARLTDSDAHALATYVRLILPVRKDIERLQANR